MFNRLWVRIALIFVVIILLGAGTIGFAARRLVDGDTRGRFVEQQVNSREGLIKKLAFAHEKNEGWNNVEPFMDGVQSGAWGGGRSNSFFFVLKDADKKIIYDPRPEKFIRDINERNIGAPALQPIINKKNQPPIGYLQIWRWRQQNAPRPPQGTDIFFDLSRTLQLLLLFSVPLGILGSIWVSRLLTSPLNQLVEAARDVGSGNLDRRVALSGTVELREMAHAFNEMTSGLEEAEQLRRNLVADIAHELRTPLTVVQGNLRAILDDVYPLNKEEIARLYDQTRILAQLVQDLRDVAQAEAGQLELNLATTDVGQLVEKTVSTFGSIAEEEGVALQIDTRDNLPTVQIDSTRIAQVLHNLLSNAVRHTPRNGSISVGVSMGQSGGQNDESASDKSIEISISDSGAGIDVEHLPRIFDRFYRTERSRDRDSGGTGLGLAIAQALVEAHGGSIRAQSPGIGKGSTFTISLPVEQ